MFIMMYCSLTIQIFVFAFPKIVKFYQVKYEMLLNDSCLYLDLQFHHFILINFLMW